MNCIPGEKLYPNTQCKTTDVCVCLFGFFFTPVLSCPQDDTRENCCAEENYRVPATWTGDRVCTFVKPVSNPRAKTINRCRALIVTYNSQKSTEQPCGVCVCVCGRAFFSQPPPPVSYITLWNLWCNWCPPSTPAPVRNAQRTWPRTRKRINRNHRK